MSRDDRSQYQLSAMHAAEQPATSGDRLQQPATSGDRLQQPATSGDRLQQPATSNQQPAGIISSQPATSGCRLQSTSNQPGPPQTNQSCLMMPIYRYDQPSHPNTIPTESSVYHTNRVIRIPYQPSHAYTILQYTSLGTPPGARLTDSPLSIYTVYTFTSYAATRVQLVQNHQSVTRMRYKN